ncbi:hypothetical protein JMM81_22055 [Bacillus sp. V3B]|uniref:hypothetical protein n=1 Tax=Bacillus sp. V3B TaxID=2804915 RepID=UPI002108D0B2|nr:hypothetical protein [Bacillus sp. V3B]MCQ6277544.1 hypothetical protein [Bacillus sp. V3B]
MLLGLAIYFLIGFTGLLFTKVHSLNELLKKFTFVTLWPFFLLLKYVEMIENMKKENRSRSQE